MWPSSYADLLRGDGHPCWCCTASSAGSTPRIPTVSRVLWARLLTIERGGHLYLGAEARVRREVAGFIRAHSPAKHSPLAVAANPR